MTFPNIQTLSHFQTIYKQSLGSDLVQYSVEKTLIHLLLYVIHAVHILTQLMQQPTCALNKILLMDCTLLSAHVGCCIK